MSVYEKMPKINLVAPEEARRKLAPFRRLVSADLATGFLPGGGILPLIVVSPLPMHGDHRLTAGIVTGAQAEDCWFYVDLKLHDGPRPGPHFRWRFSLDQAGWPLAAAGRGFGLTETGAGSRQVRAIPWSTLEPMDWAALAKTFAVAKDLLGAARR